MNPPWHRRLFVNDPCSWSQGSLRSVSCPWAIGTVQPVGWRSWLGFPAHPYYIDLAETQGGVLGTTESAISATLYRLAFNAASSGWKVFFFDAQGSQEQAAFFVAAMQQAGHRRVHVFPHDPYGGWQGSGRAQLHRLLQMSTHSREPYYQHIQTISLAAALQQESAPIQSMDELVDRLRPIRPIRGLTQREPSIDSVLARIRTTDRFGALLRYQALAILAGTSLNGTWSYDHADAAYFSFKAWSRPEEARHQARFLLADLADYLEERAAEEPPQVLVLIKHPEQLFEMEYIASLFARMQQSQGSLFIAARSLDDFGRSASHVLQNAPMWLVHRSRTWRPFETSLPRRRRYTLPSEEHLQHLGDQDCFAIGNGSVKQVRITPVSIPYRALLHAARNLTPSSPTASDGENDATFFEPDILYPMDQDKEWMNWGKAEGAEEPEKHGYS
jgi:hypothetical protein